MTTFMKKVTLEFWTCVPGNPRQRDTARHANKIERHLQIATLTQAIVHAAQLPSGKFVKLDGHTRCLLWDEDRIPVPNKLSMVVTPVSDMAEAMRLYDTFDNGLATEVKADKYFGAFREIGFRPTSKVMIAGKVATAFETATMALDASKVSKNSSTVDIVREWERELPVFDRIIAGHGLSRLPSGILAAIILTTRRNPVRAERFWGLFLDNAGVGMVRDPHNVLLKFLRKAQAEKRTAGTANIMNICEKALSAFEHSLEGNSITYLKGRNVQGYLAG